VLRFGALSSLTNGASAVDGAGRLWDDQPKASLSTVELSRALNKSRRLTGNQLDLLFLDACSMGQIEVAYELCDSARYLLALPNWKWSAFPLSQSAQVVVCRRQAICDCPASDPQSTRFTSRSSVADRVSGAEDHSSAPPPE